ncbi:chloride channel protein, partial [Acinetobacter baumannii]
VWGNGYSLVNSLLHTTWLWQAVLMVLVIKVLATAITVGSGAVGGIFTPTLFVGAAVGYLFGDTAQALLPFHMSQPFAYA